jgi:hypothetical protein
VKYRDGEKKIIVGPSVPVTRLEVATRANSSRASPSRLPQPPRSLTVPSPPPASTLAAATSCPERPALKVSSGNYGPDRRSAEDVALGWRIRARKVQRAVRHEAVEQPPCLRNSMRRATVRVGG